MAASTSPRATRSSSLASENEAGPGLVAARHRPPRPGRIARKPGIARQTPRVSITIQRVALAKRRLGPERAQALFRLGHDGRPETELNFKFYRQATNKIVGISDEAGGVPPRFF